MVLKRFTTFRAMFQLILHLFQRFQLILNSFLTLFCQKVCRNNGPPTPGSAPTPPVPAPPALQSLPPVQTDAVLDRRHYTSAMDW